MSSKEHKREINAFFKKIKQIVENISNVSKEADKSIIKTIELIKKQLDTKSSPESEFAILEYKAEFEKLHTIFTQAIESFNIFKKQCKKTTSMKHKVNQIKQIHDIIMLFSDPKKSPINKFGKLMEQIKPPSNDKEKSVVQVSDKGEPVVQTKE